MHIYINTYIRFRIKKNLGILREGQEAVHVTGITSGNDQPIFRIGRRHERIYTGLLCCNNRVRINIQRFSKTPFRLIYVSKETNRTCSSSFRHSSLMANSKAVLPSLSLTSTSALCFRSALMHLSLPCIAA